LPETHRVTVRGAERSWPLWLLIATAVLLLSGCAAQSSQQEPPQPTKEQAREPQTGGSGSVDEVAYRLGSPALGDLGAPVVMVEYGDFQ
jgi:protein-disulfide isomerase